MRYFLSILVALAWGLWFGGLVFMFLFINQLFNSMEQNYKTVFDVVAPQQFMMASRFEMVVGALALLATFGLRVTSPDHAVTGLFVLLLATGALAICKPLFIMPKMLSLIRPGQTPLPGFARLHGLSMMASAGEVFLLLGAGALLPIVLRLSSSAGGSESRSP